MDLNEFIKQWEHISTTKNIIKTIAGKPTQPRKANWLVTLPNGDKYKGEWRDGEFNGKGIYYYTNGGKYDGQFKEGNMDGKGEYCFEDGSKYNGEWKDNVEHGTGNYWLVNGDKYIGQYL